MRRCPVDAWASLSLGTACSTPPRFFRWPIPFLRVSGWTPPELDLVVCSLGPGSFTGIRIGLATALGIGTGPGIPVVGVSTLDAIAARGKATDGDVFPVIDARKGKIYTAQFARGMRAGDYLDISPAGLAARLARRADEPILAGPDACADPRACLGTRARRARGRSCWIPARFSASGRRSSSGREPTRRSSARCTCGKASGDRERDVTHGQSVRRSHRRAGRGGWRASRRAAAEQSGSAAILDTPEFSRWTTSFLTDEDPEPFPGPEPEDPPGERKLLPHVRLR